MERQAIGKTPVKVTSIMFGTSALGNMPDTYGYGVDEDRARATLDAIFDGPMNCLDTSNNYGFGRSEARIGEAIRARGGLPAGFVISTKLDREMETGKFDADQARRSIEQSLDRLGVDKVGLLHLHDPEHAADLGEITCKGGALDFPSPRPVTSIRSRSTRVRITPAQFTPRMYSISMRPTGWR